MRILTNKPQKRPTSFDSSHKKGVAQDEEIVRAGLKDLGSTVTAGL